MIKQMIKVIKISPKISVRTILITKPVILSHNGQKASKRQTIVGFSNKILEFCLRIKTFVRMLEKEFFFAKFRTMILNIVKIHKNLVKKTNIECANFQDCP